MVERLQERKELHKQRSRAYRLAFGAAGFAVLLAGIVLSLPFVPGPGLLLVAIGLGMLALEFAWAERLLARILDRLEQAGERAARATPAQKAVAGLALAAGAAAVIAVAFLWDVPGVPL
jgi:uncharacterized protein (TIGR02611 family)